MGKRDQKPNPQSPPNSADDLFSQAPLPTAPLNDQQRLACLRLIRSENVGPVTFAQLINHYGGAEHALAALPDLAHKGGKRSIKVCPRERAEAELAAAEKHHAKPVFTIEPGYPSALANIPAPPPLVYIKGNASLFEKPSVAIVGARQASGAGTKLARMLAQDLASEGLVITSGLARGIDGAAHQAALEYGTVAVLAGGLDIIYPPEHERLHEQIAEQGCLLSEMPCGFQPRGQDFPRRNRLISGLSLGVVVIEAARRSGTLVTARYAVEQNKDVYAIPGHPLDPRSEGTNQLIKSGAMLVTSARDILEELAPMLALRQTTSDGFHEQSAPSAPNEARQNLSANTCTPQSASNSDQIRSRVLEALGPAPIDVDELCRATQFPARDINVALLELDLAGLIERHGHQLISRGDP